ncbi:MAG: radical SAM protein [Nanoarchaeota archaeon]|nr:radical SAM protein [Nanoarchaeota archaeon]
MSIIYEPTGKAREYSPLAANLYSGCGHKCKYCYVPNVIKLEKKIFDNQTTERNSIIENLRKDAKKLKGTNKQVLMSFTTDPYNPFNNIAKLTRKALEIFLENQIPVAILTKGGMRAIQDLDVIKKFGEHIKIGASLIYDNDIDSKRVESGAALPNERLEMLKVFFKNHIKTWVSFEPIIQPKQTLNLLKQCLEYVDEFQFGKLADDKRSFDWNNFVNTIINILRNKNKEFYIKETLRKAAYKVQLQPKEIDVDYLTLKPFEQIKETLF